MNSRENKEIATRLAIEKEIYAIEDTLKMVSPNVMIETLMSMAIIFIIVKLILHILAT